MDPFNEHQKDVRQRVDSLCKAVFVLAGGALTISIGIFTNAKIVLTEYLKCILTLSWWSLFICIISLVLVLFTVITRDYFFGEKWRKSYQGESKDLTGNPGVLEKIIWLLSIVGLIAFITGYFLLAYVATNAINTQQETMVPIGCWLGA